ncbi:MAG: 2-oxoglutarate dehydrogenase, E2 component, dihydrolipoamide succinyltransferase [Acidobacteriota bacterium]|nr:2-oxoglutarate dehydrogenase, E2 component, dihydrolipoamide succinyltransferase [Blastocatellia bacterium]MDW8241219.1 2-oxoglutarate dehydrogenase, E2 component, dihydrolipoamide succinyltransferase [Acidobacteriota bacterium]
MLYLPANVPPQDDAETRRQGMMTDILMPQMGESIVEGTVTRWLKKVGDHVERDEPLFEISTDKVDVEIPSPTSGTLVEILVEEGRTVAINTVVARIGDVAAAQPPAATEPASAISPSPDVTSAPSPAAASGAAPPRRQKPATGFLSPFVRRMARINNIDLTQIKGTGANGRITKADIEAYLASRRLAVAAPAPSVEPAAPPAPASVAVAPPPPQRLPAGARVEPMSIMRQKIAEHMVMSKHTSAHVTSVHRVDMTRIVKLRDRIKQEFEQRYGFGLTYLPFVIRATVEALRAFPIFNASIDGTNIIYHQEINIGIAVALDNGLIVPVIRQADEKTIAGLQRAIVDLATRARTRALKPEEVAGGTFTITNLGSFGSLFGTPVINQPQVAILGLGAIEKMPVVIEDDAIAIRSMAYLALTFDHRLIDGALAGQFCTKVKQVLENFQETVL